MLLEDLVPVLHRYQFNSGVCKLAARTTVHLTLTIREALV